MKTLKELKTLNKTYICAMCGKEKELTTPIDDMIKECEENFNYTPTKEEVKEGIVCDDCYNKPDITRAMAFTKNTEEDLK